MACAFGVGAGERIQGGGESETDSRRYFDRCLLYSQKARARTSAPSGRKSRAKHIRRIIGGTYGKRVVGGNVILQ